MMSVRTTNFDAVAAAAPLNREASTVRDGSGEHYDKACSAYANVNRWDVLPQMKAASEMSAPGRAILRDQQGRRYGRMVVLGVWAGGNDKKRATWVCRCDCGYYEGRKLKGLIGAFDDPCCSHCAQTEKLRRLASTASTGARRRAEAARLDTLAGAPPVVGEGSRDTIKEPVSSLSNLRRQG